MQLSFGPEIEAFRAEFSAFLDAHLPPAETTHERISSSAYLPDWARRWQRTMFDHGWLQPGNAPEFGGRNAGIVEQFVYFEELGRRRLAQTFNPRVSASSPPPDRVRHTGTATKMGHSDPARGDHRRPGHE